MLRAVVDDEIGEHGLHGDPKECKAATREDDDDEGREREGEWEEGDGGGGYI